MNGINLTAQSATSPATQYFYNRATFPTGADPLGVSIADMNGDGREDLVVANSNDGTVSVLLGQLDGTFGNKTDFLAETFPQVVVTGDFNQDGNVDVAVAGNNGVAILLGNGDGTLRAPTIYPTTDVPDLMLLSDFNQDGKVDLAIAGNCGTTCGFYSVLLGNGDGTFKVGPEISPGAVPNSFATSDLDGDGHLDLVFTGLHSKSPSGGSGGTISVLLGNGNGTWKAPVSVATGDDIGYIAIGDVTGDKIPDLILGHSGTGINFMKGNGKGTFGVEQTAYADRILTPNFLQLQDLNNDGKLDVITTSGSYNGIATLIGNGDGTFQNAQSFQTGTESYFFAQADSNGDGNIDLAVVDRFGGYVAILLGNGDGSFGPRQPLLSQVSSTVETSGAIADFNGDGKADLAVSTQSGMQVFLGNGHGAFTHLQTLGTDLTEPFNKVIAGDFNDDGHPDLIENGTTY